MIAQRDPKLLLQTAHPSNLELTAIHDFSCDPQATEVSQGPADRARSLLYMAFSKREALGIWGHPSGETMGISHWIPHAAQRD